MGDILNVIHQGAALISRHY